MREVKKVKDKISKSSRATRKYEYIFRPLLQLLSSLSRRKQNLTQRKLLAKLLSCLYISFFVLCSRTMKVEGQSMY